MTSGTRTRSSKSSCTTQTQASACPKWTQSRSWPSLTTTNPAFCHSRQRMRRSSTCELSPSAALWLRAQTAPMEKSLASTGLFSWTTPSRDRQSPAKTTSRPKALSPSKLRSSAKTSLSKSSHALKVMTQSTKTKCSACRSTRQRQKQSKFRRKTFAQ